MTPPDLTELEYTKYLIRGAKAEKALGGVGLGIYEKLVHLPFDTTRFLCGDAKPRLLGLIIATVSGSCMRHGLTYKETGNRKDLDTMIQRLEQHAARAQQT